MLEKILEVPWTTRRSKPVNPKGNQPQIFIGKDPDARKGKGRRRGQQKMRWSDSLTDSMHMNLSNLWEIVKDRGTWCAAVHRITKSWT